MRFPALSNKQHHFIFSAILAFATLRTAAEFIKIAICQATTFEHGVPAYSGNDKVQIRPKHICDTIKTQPISSILSIWPNYCSLQFCKNSLMLSNFSLVLNSSVEILSYDLIFFIRLTIPASFHSSLITSSFWTGQLFQVSHSIMLHKHTKYNLSFNPKGKSLLANKSTYSVHFWYLL